MALRSLLSAVALADARRHGVGFNRRSCADRLYHKWALPAQWGIKPTSILVTG